MIPTTKQKHGKMRNLFYRMTMMHITSECTFTTLFNNSFIIINVAFCGTCNKTVNSVFSQPILRDMTKMEGLISTRSKDHLKTIKGGRKKPWILPNNMF